jgi:hypothetical protein
VLMDFNAITLVAAIAVALALIGAMLFLAAS